MKSVLDVLQTHGPLTIEQISMILDISPQTIRANLNELNKRGKVTMYGKAPGSVKGVYRYVWGLTE